MNEENIWCILILVLKIFSFASDTVYKYVQPPNFFELPPPMQYILMHHEHH